MALTLQIVAKPDDVLLETMTKQFVEQGGSIGRAEHCDLYLPDPSQHISKIHALIHFRDQMYFITDVSTNGVFVNAETIAIGKGNTKQILEGERFRIGNYVLQASLNDRLATNVARPALRSVDDEIEALLANDDDISDLLDVEVNQQQVSKHSIIADDELNIDQILAHLEQPEAADLAEFNNHNDELEELLGQASLNDRPSKIDVLSGSPTNVNNAEQVFANVLHQLDQYALQHPESNKIIAAIRLHLQAQKNQII